MLHKFNPRQILLYTVNFTTGYDTYPGLNILRRNLILLSSEKAKDTL